MAHPLQALRDVMAEHQIDAYLIPTADFHGSEYVGEHFACREYISGFTGSAGTLLVFANWAGLWTDGRYFLQAAEELKGCLLYTSILLNPLITLSTVAILFTCSLAWYQRKLGG